MRSEEYPLKKNNIIARIDNIRRSSIFWGILMFRITLDTVYSPVIVDQFWHYGFVAEFDIVRYLLSYIAMLVVTGMFIPMISLNKPSSILLMLLYILAYIPNMSLFSNMSLPYTYFLMSNLYWMCIVIFYKYINFNINIKLSDRRVVRKNHKRNMYSYIIFLLFFVIITVYSIVYNEGIKLTLDLGDVYSLRMASRAKGIGDIFEKLLPWSANIIFPLGIIKAIRDKQWVLAAVFLIGEVFAFSVNGTKTWLFICAISLFVSLFIKKDKYIGLLPFFLSASVGIGAILGKCLKWSFIDNYITRRVFFSTSLSNYFWLDFFSENSKMYLTNSVFGWLRRFGVALPYDKNISLIIGSLYYNNDEMTAASGTMANAYGNLGILGVILFPLILVIVAKFLDRVSRNSKIVYLYPIIISTSIYLLNGSMMSTFVTYGYFIGLLLVWYLNRKNELSR